MPLLFIIFFILSSKFSYSQICNDSIPLEPCSFEFNRCYLLDKLKLYNDSTHLDVQELFLIGDYWDRCKENLFIDKLDSEAFLKLIKLESFASPVFIPIPEQIAQNQQLKNIRQYPYRSLSLTNPLYEEFTPLPTSLWTLPKLETLVIFTNTIPDDLAELKSLKYLSIHSDSLSHLPPSSNWEELKNLKNLHFYANWFSEEYLFCWSTLELNSFTFIVNYTDQPLKAYFESIKKSQSSIQSINISTHLSGGVTKEKIEFNLKSNYPKLTTLKLAHCNIAKFSFKPTLIPELKQLDLSNNQLKGLPCSIARLQQLRIIYIENNPILKVPKALKKLKHLETIYVSKDINERVLRKLINWFGKEKIIKKD